MHKPAEIARLERARRAVAQRPAKFNGASRARPEKPGLNQSESPLAWLMRRRGKEGAGLITSDQFAAGERLRRDFTIACLMPSVTTNWSATSGISSGSRGAPGAGLELTDAAIAAGQRVRRALAAVGPELNGILIDVCCHLKGLEDMERGAGWPQRSAKVVLQLALNCLARHYGLNAGARGEASGARTVRHWGAEGFRPVADPVADAGGS